MSHLHVPDGVLPLWLVLAGWLVTAGLLALASRAIPGQDLARRAPSVGVMATFMLVTQSIALPPIGYHFNLTALSGIILGPSLAFVAVFIVNLLAALFGHGGITVVGLNTLIFGTEAALAYALFHALARVVRPRRAGLAAAGAALASLVASVLLTLGILTAAAANPGWPAPRGPEYFELPHLPGQEPTVVELPDAAERAAPTQEVARLAIVLLAFGLIGWPLEAGLTGLVVAYLGAVRPDLLRSDGARVQPSHAGG